MVTVSSTNTSVLTAFRQSCTVNVHFLFMDHVASSPICVLETTSTSWRKLLSVFFKTGCLFRSLTHLAIKSVTCIKLTLLCKCKKSRNNNFFLKEKKHVNYNYAQKFQKKFCHCTSLIYINGRALYKRWGDVRWCVLKDHCGWPYGWPHHLSTSLGLFFNVSVCMKWPTLTLAQRTSTSP